MARRAKLACLSILILSACALLPAAHAEDDDNSNKSPEASMHEQILSIPGDPARPVQLQTTLFEPPGDGPFPLAIMNHGAKGNPRSVKRYRTSFSIDYLLSRGYAVLAPMMRGFAGSTGEYLSLGCDYDRIGRLNAADIQAVIDYAAQHREIDATRVVVVGQSYGGWNSLAYGTVATPAVKGVINFVGGMQAYDCNQHERAMRDAVEKFGRDAKVPSLWFYGERDQLFPEQLWSQTYQLYTQAGGHAELVDFGAVDDAHNLLGHGEWLNIWVPKVDAFLERVGLPNAELYPEYLPTPAPPKTNYAQIADGAAVPFIGASNGGFYQKFLANTLPRALVVGLKFASEQSGGFDPIARATKECQAHSEYCMLYAYNNEVVWQGPAAGQSITTNGVIINGKSAAPTVTGTIQRFVSLEKDCTQTPLPALEITQQPSHGSLTIDIVQTKAAFATTSPLASCNGKTIPEERINYTPEAGFKGVDFMSVLLSATSKPAQMYKFSAHVE